MTHDSYHILPGPAKAGVFLEGEGTCSTLLLVLRRLWFFFVVIFLTIIMFAILGPLFQYVILTFFASYHGGGDCMVTPKSKPCRLAAGDLMKYNSAVEFLTSSVATVSALTLGSWSDTIGRRMIMMVKAILSVALIYSLALHQLVGVSLWVFLIITPVVPMWDFNGVIMALMSDMIPERELRGAAMSILIALTLIVALVCMSLAKILPISISLEVALAAGTAKLVFYFTLFPETLNRALSSHSHQRRGPVGALRAASQIIVRNSFIFRMACLAVVSAVSVVGTLLTASPYMTAYIGMKREQMITMYIAAMISVLLTLGVLAKPLTKCCGDVRTYQLCQFAIALMPACLCLCTKPWQVIAVMALFAGPSILQIPIISAIKSNLVRDTEQGLVQGALASLVNLARALAAPIFGWMYNMSTEGGVAQSHSAAFPSLLTASGVGLLAFLMSLSLPLEVPAP